MKRRAVALEGDAPAGGGFVGVGGAEVGEVGNGAQGHQVLDGLVRGAVFAEAMESWVKMKSEWNAHERGQAQGRLAVVGEDEEGRAEGDQAAVGGDAVDGGAHGELADAEEDVAAGGVDVEAGAVLEDGLGGGGEVGRAAEELGDGLFEGVHDDLAGVAGGYRLVGREAGDGFLPVGLALMLAWVRSNSAASSGLAAL
jgi:hypothetical protein